MASDKDAGTVGIGAGAALNIVFDTTTASIDDGAALTGAKNVTLSATDTDANTTYAEAGAGGSGSDSDLALTRELQAGARLFHLRVLDHLVVGAGRFTSLAQTGFLRLEPVRAGNAPLTGEDKR